MNKEVLLKIDTPFVIATILALLCSIWTALISLYGGKIWLIGYWLLLLAWCIPISISASKKYWRSREWIVQSIIFAICFAISAKQAIIFTMWAVNGFAP